MKYRKRNWRQRIYSFVGMVTTFAIVALVSLTCLMIKVRAEKEGIAFGQCAAKLFLGEPKKPAETYTGSGGELPNLEKIAEKQAGAKRLPEPVPISNGGKSTAKPVSYSAPAPTDEAIVCPSCKRFHLKSVTCADDAAFTNSATKPRVYTVKAPTKKEIKEAKAQQKKWNEAAERQPKTVKWTAADNTPHGGRSVGLPVSNEMSDLEKEAAYKVRNQRSLEQIKKEVERLKNGEVAPKQKADVWSGMSTSFEFLGNVFKDY